MKPTIFLLAGIIALSAAGPASAHFVDPTIIEICGFDSASTATFSVDDGGSCSALITAQSSAPAVATVTPGAISAVSTVFTVQANGIGMATITVGWTGEGPNCTDVGSSTVTVIVRDRNHPICRGNGDLGFAFTPFPGSTTGQYLTTTNQRGANVVMTHTPHSCDCSKVIITQMIKIGDGPWKIDVDTSVTNVETPFYNYDPATGMGVPVSDIGGPGDCSGNNNAVLQDNPLQTTQPVVWEACAICCDDGRVLDCRKWSYDPTLDRGTVTSDGERKKGLYVDDGRIADFNADARAAYRDGIASYLASHPTSSSDECLSNFQMSLNEPPNTILPPPPTTGTTPPSDGCAVGGTSPSLWLYLLCLCLLRRRVKA